METLFGKDNLGPISRPASLRPRGGSRQLHPRRRFAEHAERNLEQAGARTGNAPRCAAAAADHAPRHGHTGGAPLLRKDDAHPVRPGRDRHLIRYRPQQAARPAAHRHRLVDGQRRAAAGAARIPGALSRHPDRTRRFGPGRRPDRRQRRLRHPRRRAGRLVVGGAQHRPGHDGHLRRAVLPEAIRHAGLSGRTEKRPSPGQLCPDHERARPAVQVCARRRERGNQGGAPGRHQ